MHKYVMLEMKNACTILVGEKKKKIVYHFGELGEDGRVILQQMLENQDVKV